MSVTQSIDDVDCPDCGGTGMCPKGSGDLCWTCHPDARDANAFQRFSMINRHRADRWHRGSIMSWSVADWSNAMAGEAGAVCNAVKKFRRVEDALIAHGGDTPQPHSLIDARNAVAKEIGDVYAYLDLLAQRFDLDIFACIRNTFNKISEREGFPERFMPEIQR